MLKWVSSGWCGTRSGFQHLTEAQLWLQLVRDGKVSNLVLYARCQKNKLIQFQSKVLEEYLFKGQAPEKRYEKHI